MTSMVLAEGVPDFRCLQWMIYNLGNCSTPQRHEFKVSCEVWNVDPSPIKITTVNPHGVPIESNITRNPDSPWFSPWSWIFGWKKPWENHKKNLQKSPRKRCTYRTWSLAFSKCSGLGQIETRLWSVVPEDAHRNFKWVQPVEQTITKSSHHHPCTTSCTTSWAFRTVFSPHPQSKNEGYKDPAASVSFCSTGISANPPKPYNLLWIVETWTNFPRKFRSQQLGDQRPQNELFTAGWSWGRRLPDWIFHWRYKIPDIYIYTWKTVWPFFLSIMGFTRNGRFFCSIAYFGFWLWRVVQILWQHRVRTSSDSFQKRNFSPKWSKLGVVIGHPNLATNTAIFPTKFGCTHKIPVFFQHHVEKKQYANVNILPQILSLDETLILSEPVRQIQEFRKTIN